MIVFQSKLMGIARPPQGLECSSTHRERLLICCSKARSSGALTKAGAFKSRRRLQFQKLCASASLWQKICVRPRPSVVKNRFLPKHLRSRFPKVIQGYSRLFKEFLKSIFYSFPIGSSLKASLPLPIGRMQKVFN